MANLKQDERGPICAKLPEVGTTGSTGMAGNLLETTRMLHPGTCHATLLGKIARVTFVTHNTAMLVAERAFEMLRFLEMGHSETILENFILAETTEQSPKTFVSHLPRVTGTALLVPELSQETQVAFATSLLPNLSTFEIQEMRHTIETSLLPEIMHLAAEVGVVNCTMDQLGHSAKAGIPTMTSIFPEIAEANRLNPSGKVPMVTTIVKTFVTAQITGTISLQTTGTFSLEAFVTTETTAVIANRFQCRSRIIETTLDSETLHSVSPTRLQGLFVTALTIGNLRLRIEIIVATANRSLQHITKTASIRQPLPIEIGSETKSLFLETETFLMFLLVIK